MLIHRPKLIISGGQSGADIAGLLAAKELEIPRDANIFPTFIPINSSVNRLRLIATVKYVVPQGVPYIQSLKKRTDYNVRHSDATIIFVRRNIANTRGSLLTQTLCNENKKPYLVLQEALEDASDQVRMFLGEKYPHTLNIAGERFCDEALVKDVLVRAMSE